MVNTQGTVYLEVSKDGTSWWKAASAKTGTFSVDLGGTASRKDIFLRVRVVSQSLDAQNPAVIIKRVWIGPKADPQRPGAPPYGDDGFENGEPQYEGGKWTPPKDGQPSDHIWQEDDFPDYATQATPEPGAEQGNGQEQTPWPTPLAGTATPTTPATATSTPSDGGGETIQPTPQPAAITPVPHTQPTPTPEAPAAHRNLTETINDLVKDVVLWLRGLAGRK